MGLGSSKKKRNITSHHGCSCKMYDKCGHCCNSQCLGEKCLKKKREELALALKKYNCEYLTNTIMQYLPTLEIIQFNCKPYHDKYLVYIHSTTVDIWPKLPCTYWRKYVGCGVEKNDNQSYENVKELKIVVLGYGGVGKSALVIRFLTDNFLEEYDHDPTIEDSYRKMVTVNGQRLLYDILDIYTAAQGECFRSMQDEWMREGEFFLLCFAVNDELSFDEVIQTRERVINTKGDENSNYGMILVGTKADLLYDEQWQQQNKQEKYPKKFVDRNIAIQQAIEWNVPYIETSAKKRKNNEFVFEQVFYELWIQTQGQVHVDQ